MTKTLILTVGLPRSGKSTWARSQGFPIVNRDAIRLSVHGQPFIKEAESIITAIEDTMVRALLKCHDTVIIDATHLKVDYIKKWQKFGAKLKFRYFDTSMEICMERADASGKPYLIPIIRDMELDRIALLDMLKGIT